MSSTENRQPLHPLFRLLALVAVVFIITVFALVATTFSSRQSPAADFFTRHGTMLICVEVVVMLVLCVAAIAVDRRNSIRRLQEIEQRVMASLPERPVRAADEEFLDGDFNNGNSEEGHGDRDPERN